MSANDELLTVDGVQCKPQKSNMLTCGVNVPKPLRFPMKRKADDDGTCKAVRQHPKFGAALAAISADGSSSSPPPAPPPLPGSSAPSMKIGTRELESLRELSAAADGSAMRVQPTHGDAAEEEAAPALSGRPAQSSQRQAVAWPPCSTCNRAHGKYYRFDDGRGISLHLCEGCLPKDEHGNELCMRHVPVRR